MQSLQTFRSKELDMVCNCVVVRCDSASELVVPVLTVPFVHSVEDGCGILECLMMDLV